jgi:hypothetical protein
LPEQITHLGLVAVVGRSKQGRDILRQSPGISAGVRLHIPADKDIRAVGPFDLL